MWDFLTFLKTGVTEVSANRLVLPHEDNMIKSACSLSPPSSTALPPGGSSCLLTSLLGHCTSLWMQPVQWAQRVHHTHHCWPQTNCLLNISPQYIHMTNSVCVCVCVCVRAPDCSPKQWCYTHLLHAGLLGVQYIDLYTCPSIKYSQVWNILDSDNEHLSEPPQMSAMQFTFDHPPHTHTHTHTTHTHIHNTHTWIITSCGKVRRSTASRRFVFRPQSLPTSLVPFKPLAAFVVTGWLCCFVMA